MRINSISNQSFGKLHATEKQKKEIYTNLNEDERRILDAISASYVEDIKISEDGDVYVQVGINKPAEDIFSHADNLTDKVKIAMEFIDEVINYHPGPKKFKVYKIGNDPYYRYSGETIAPSVEYYGCGWGY